MGKQYNSQFTVFTDKEKVMLICMYSVKQGGWQAGLDKKAGIIRVQTPESLSNWSYGVNLSVQIIPSATSSQTTVSVTTECRTKYGFLKGSGESKGEAEEVAKKFLIIAVAHLEKNAIKYETPKEFVK